MKAIMWVDVAKLELQDIPKPQAGAGDILIQVKAAGICGGDMHAYNGTMGKKGNPPFVLGHEFAGIIVEKGANVDDYWKIGDRVVSENTGDACGRCPSCAAGNFVNCAQRRILGGGMDGGFAEYVKIPAKILQMYPNCLFHIPDNLSFPEATVLEPAANAYKAVIQEGHLRPGETVLVFGAGALGLLSIKMAKLAGAAKIILVGLSLDKAVRIPMAKSFGATDVIVSDETDDLNGRIQEIAGHNGLSLVIDAAGAPQVFSTALQVLRNEGRYVRIGLSGRPLNESINALTLKSITIKGHNGYNTESWRNCIALAKAGILDLKSIITCELPIEKFTEGFESYKRQESTKIILIP